jgi:hypothetical protein
MRGPLAAALAIGLIALAGCGNGGKDNAAETTTTAIPPKASTLPGKTQTQTQTQTTPTTPTSPYSTVPQAPGEGNGGAAAPPSSGNGGTPAP